MKAITEIGVVVRDLDKATQLFVNMLGAKAGDIITVPRYGMRYRMCRLANIDFELMEPLDGEGVIGRFIKCRGEGLHHVAFAVENLDETLAGLKTKGVKLIDEEPKELHGSRYAFVHPSGFVGVMFELIEYPEGSDLP